MDVFRLMEQLRLFPADDQLTVIVFNYGDYYQAELFNGWWVARGKSAKEAVEKVVKLYEGEL